MSVQYVVEAVQPQQRTATVLFFNPYHTGEHLKEIEYMNADGVQIRIEDHDPNPHLRKLVNIPFTEDGTPDTAAFTAMLAEQAEGVASRMEAERQTSKAEPDPELMMALVGTISAPA